MLQSKHGVQNEWHDQEREKRNMAAPTPQFKIKKDLEWGFVRVVYAISFKWMYQLSIKNTTHRKKEDINQVKTFFLVGECNLVKMLFLLVENGTEWRHYSCWWRMWLNDDTIFVSDHWNPFHPVREPNKLTWGNLTSNSSQSLTALHLGH